MTKGKKEHGSGLTAVPSTLKAGITHLLGRERTTVLYSSTSMSMKEGGMSSSVTYLSTLSVPDLFVQVNKNEDY